MVTENSFSSKVFRTNLLNSLKEWSNHEKTKDAQLDCRERAVHQILKLKDEVRVIEQVRKALLNTLADLSTLIASKEKKIRDAFDSMSPLLSLK